MQDIFSFFFNFWDILLFSSGEGRTLVVLLDLLLLSVGELLLLGGGFRGHVDEEGLRAKSRVVERERNCDHVNKNWGDSCAEVSFFF